MKRRIVLDTDMGTDVDDALALALALASPEIELVAVTHVSKDTRRRAQISKRLLELAGRGDIPVHPGCAAPLSGHDAFLWVGHEGDGILEPETPSNVSEEPADQALGRLFRADDDLELVAIGPLTNLAAAIDRDPGFATRVRRLTIMGGHIRSVAYKGHPFPPGVDYNLCSDPAASLRVLRSGIPTRLATADVTLQVWLRPEDLRRLETSARSFQQALARAIRVWTPIMGRIFAGMGVETGSDNVAFLHDPLAMASVYDESFCRFEDLQIEPAIADGTFRTIERGAAASGVTFPMRCATAVDANAFRAHVLDRLLSFAPAGR